MGDSARRARIAVVNDDTDFLDLMRDRISSFRTSASAAKNTAGRF
jgi:hypothetical protein